MAQPPLLALATDVDRLLAAGARLAVGDEGLRQRGQALRDLTARVPAVAPLADAVERVTRARAAQVAPALLDLFVLMRQVRASLATAGVAGSVEPSEVCGPWDTSHPVAEVTALLDSLTVLGGEGAKELGDSDCLGDLRLVGPLLDYLERENDRRAPVVEDQILFGFGRRLVPELRRDLQQKSAPVAGRRLALLCRIDRAAGLEACRALLAEGGEPHRIEALPQLAALAPDEGSERALALLGQDTGEEMRAAALTALRYARTDAALDVLLAAVEEAPAAWSAACRALGASHHPNAGRRLVQELESTIAPLNPAPDGVAAPPLKKAQLKSLLQRAQRLAEALAHRPREEGQALLTRLMNHPHAELRRAVVNHLGRRCPKSWVAGRFLLQKLQERPDHEGYAAARRLGDLGLDPDIIVPGLVELLQDRRDMVRRNAAVVLGKMGPSAIAAVPALSRAVSDNNAVVRRWVLSALSHIGPGAAAAAPALIEALKNPDAWTREYAAGALQHIGLAALRGLGASLPALDALRALENQSQAERNFRVASAAGAAVRALTGETPGTV